MGFDQKGAAIFCVAPGTDGQWDVKEAGFDKPLASFKTAADARKYAQDLADTKEGSTVEMFDEHGRPVTDEPQPALLGS